MLKCYVPLLLISGMTLHIEAHVITDYISDFDLECQASLYADESSTSTELLSRPTVPNLRYAYPKGNMKNLKGHARFS